MDLNDLATGGGAAIDFDGIGSIVEGVLVGTGDDWKPIETNFGVKLKLPFNLKVGDEDRTLWVPKNSRLATVISQAFKDAGLTSITNGGTLKIQRIEDQPTNKGNPMRDYRAKYTPAATSVSIGDLADEEPF